MRRSAILFTLLILTWPGGLTSASSGEMDDAGPVLDWPQWRGPNRDAVSAETGLLREWPEEGPREIWRVEAGAGFSGVSVVGKGLYTMWDEAGEQHLVCLDATNGEERWRQRMGAGFKSSWGNGPRSTPLVHERIVYAFGTQGLLLAADAETGSPVWECDLVEVFEARLPTYGYASSPMITGEKLLVETAGGDAAYTAFDRRTGDILWVAHEDSPAYSSPIEITLHGVEQIVFWSAAGVHALDGEAGDELWNHGWRTDCSATGDPLGCTTPIFVAPDQLFLSSGSGAALIRILREEDEYQVKTVWASREMHNDVNSSLLFGDHVYGFDRGVLKCLDARTGVVRWKARGYHKGSLIAADGQLLVLGESGELALVDADPGGFHERSRFAVLPGKNWTTPTLAGGRLYLRNHEELVCLDLRR